MSALMLDPCPRSCRDGSGATTFIGRRSGDSVLATLASYSDNMLRSLRPDLMLVLSSAAKLALCASFMTLWHAFPGSREEGQKLAGLGGRRHVIDSLHIVEELGQQSLLLLLHLDDADRGGVCEPQRSQVMGIHAENGSTWFLAVAQLVPDVLRLSFSRPLLFL